MIFKWHQGLIWVSIDLGYEGKEHRIDNCVLDTGSATTAVDIDLVDFNYRKPANIKRLFGIRGGIQEVVSQEINAITIDCKMLKNVELEFGDFQKYLGINGFIGNDILSHFTINIDYFEKEINFTTPH